MQMNLAIEPKDLLLRLENGQRRLGYAVVNAINKTAKEIQKAEREQVAGAFTIRKENFMLRQAAVIKPFASAKQARAFAEISVGEKKGLLLSQYEKGGHRKPATSSARSVAMPSIGGPARPSVESLTPPQFKVQRLRFDKTKGGKPRAGAVKTQTFLIPALGIYQRHAGRIRQVYHFRRGMRLAPVLEFEQTAREVADRWFREFLEREVVKAIERSKGAGIE